MCEVIAVKLIEKFRFAVMKLAVNNGAQRRTVPALFDILSDLFASFLKCKFIRVVAARCLPFISSMSL